MHMITVKIIHFFIFYVTGKGTTVVLVGFFFFFYTKIFRVTEFLFYNVQFFLL